MLTSSSVKEKKKVSSSNKVNRSNNNNNNETSKKNQKVELKKTELIQLVTRFEAELQAKDIVLAALKSDKIRLLLFNAQYGRLNHPTDPYAALFRDSEYVKQGIVRKLSPIKNSYETQFLQFVIQQKKQVELLKLALEKTEKRCLLLTKELEKEKKDKIRLQTFQNHLLIAEDEKSQLQNDLNNVKLHNEELEKQLVQIMKLLENEHERHKKFLIFFLNQRKIENEHYKEKLKQLSNNHNNDDTQREIKFKELQQENERNKQVFTERIVQLQNEIDLLIKEKKQQTQNNSLSLNEEINESITKPKSKTRPLTSGDVVTVELSSSINEPSSIITNKNDVHCPTIIPTSTTSKNNSNLLTKARLSSPSISTRTQLSPSMINPTSITPELPLSPAPPISKRNNPSPQPSSVSSNLKSNTNRTVGISNSTKTVPQINKSTDLSKRINQTSFSSENKIDDIRTLLENIQAVAENRLKSEAAINDSTHSDIVLFRTVEIGDADQLLKFLKLGCNPNSQTIDGNTCLHICASHGYIECIRHLLRFGANPYLENNLGITSWNKLSQLNEIIQLECLQEFIEYGQNLPPMDLIYNAIENNRINIFDYLLSLLHEQLKNDSSSLSRLLRTALRSSNTHFLECLFAMIKIQNFIQLIDPNTFISNECLTILSSLETEEAHSKSINLTVLISSSNREHRFSYAIGKISVSINMSWLELERTCSKIFIDHITQIDSPFDYEKSSLGCSTNNIDTLTLGLIKWHYQDSPNDQSPMPYTAAREQESVIIHLKGIDMNATDSLAYNYFIPSQSLKNFIRFIEQHRFVGVYGAPYLQKNSLFEDLMRYFERTKGFSTSPKFQIIRYEFESVTSLDDCIDDFVEQNFFRTNQWQTKSLDQHHSAKTLLYFANVQNSCGSDMINLLLNSEIVSDTCFKLSYTREDNPKSTTTYYFPSMFHIFVTLSRRTWSTEAEIYKKFKWISFKIDSAPWNGLLKRHLWRRMIDRNICENRSIDHELIKTLQWVANIWQRYNECLQKLSLQDALLGPALFFDCPMEREPIFEWLQIKWNTIIAPLVREYSMNKCVQTKSKDSTNIVSSSRFNSLEISTPYESVACRTLYVLLQRAVVRDCPLTGQEREEYLLDFVGSRVEGGSCSSSRAGTPQLFNNNDFVSIQLE